MRDITDTSRFIKGVRRMTENLPDDIFIESVLDGNEVIFSDENGILVEPGVYPVLDSIRGMWAEICRQCEDFGRAYPQEAVATIDGFSGNVKRLWDTINYCYRVICDVSTADYPVPRLPNEHQPFPPDPGPDFTNR
jgi:hypothetical protein